jgi:hypothetical protein
MSSDLLRIFPAAFFLLRDAKNGFVPGDGASRGNQAPVLLAGCESDHKNRQPRLRLKSR